MFRIGVDMIEIARVRQAIERYPERFTARCFTPSERKQCGSLIERFATRFAAKEAVAKALGTGIGCEAAWIEIEIFSDENRRPHLILHGAAAELAGKLGLNSWQISLSHTQDYAIAFVVATHESEPDSYLFPSMLD